MTRAPRAVMLAVVVAAPVLVGRVFTGPLADLRAYRLGAAVCFACMALTLNIVTGYAGLLSLGHGGLLGLGGLVSGLLTADAGLPFMVAVVAAAVAGGTAGAALGLTALRLRGLAVAIATIAFAFTVQDVLVRGALLSRGYTGLEVPRPQIGTFVLERSSDYLALIVLFAAALFWVDRNIGRSKIGRAFHAIRAGEASAAAHGVAVPRYKVLAFTLSGALAGAVGALYVHLVGFMNTDSFSWERSSVLLLVLIVVGGLGSPVGAAVAGGLNGLFTVVTRQLRIWADVTAGAMLLFALARHPRGLAGVVRARRFARRSPTDDAAANSPRFSEIPRDSPTIAAGAALAARGVTVSYGGLRALDGVDVSAPAGSITAIVGPNGAGKSTLLDVMTGFVRPASGTVSLSDNDVTRLPTYDRSALGIRRTFQTSGLAGDRSAIDNLLAAQHTRASYSVLASLLHLRRARDTEHELRTRALRALEAIGVGAEADTPVEMLSIGQRRLVEIAAALIGGGTVLLLDEPTSGLAPAAVAGLAQTLRALRDQTGTTVVLVEHDLSFVDAVADVVYVLDRGRIAATGAPHEVLQLPRSRD